MSLLLEREMIPDFTDLCLSVIRMYHHHILMIGISVHFLFPNKQKLSYSLNSGLIGGCVCGVRTTYKADTN